MIVIINGSPRKKKNCIDIIKHITDKLERNSIDYVVHNIYDMNIDYCNACGFCEKTGHCRIKDDMTPMYDQFDKSNGTIVVSPVYFDSIPAKLKTVVDRTQAFFASKYILKKPSIDRNKKRVGMYIAVGGSSPYESQFKGGQIIMDFFFKSVNSKLKYNYYINSSDEMPYKDNDEHVQNIDKLINSYINEIKELGY